MNDPRAGQVASPADLVDVAHLVTAYYASTPDPSDPDQRVAFGTSGHRGSSLRSAFNEAHILAVTQAICDYRAARGYSGPLFLGRDTHGPVSYTHLRAHETDSYLVCRLLLEKKKKNTQY